MLGRRARTLSDRREEFAARSTLPRSGLELSRLGFGSSALMSRVNRRDSVRLLHTAIDEGMTHIDTARSYGFGGAELAVGDVLEGRRDKLTVTTKVGILPPRRIPGISVAKALARGLLAAAPQMRATVRRGAGTMVKPGRFEVATMRESLHASLRHLRTDYVDILLLHEPSPAVLSTEEPLAFLHEAQRAGKLRAFGIAITADLAAFAQREAPAYASLLQLPHSVFRPLGCLPSGEADCLVHSAFGDSMARLHESLKTLPELSRQWTAELQVDVMEPGALERLALQWSLADPGSQVVLITSTNSEHIRQNAATWKAAASWEQMQRFEKLVCAWKQSGDQSQASEPPF